MSRATNPPERRLPLRCLWLIAVPALLLVLIIWRAPNFSESGPAPRSDPPGGDFLQEYTGGRLVLDGRQRAALYDPDAFRQAQHDESALGFAWNDNRYFPAVYPPVWYAAVSPLSRLEYLTAARVWLAAMTVCLAASLGLLWRFANVPVALLTGLCFSTPVLISLTSGQKGTLLLLILTACWCLLRSNRPFGAGATFGLIAFKPHLGLPMGLVMLAGRRWRWVLGTWTTLLLLVVASMWAGPQMIRGYIDVCWGFGDYVQSGGYRLEQGFSLWSALQLATGNPHTARLATVSLSGVLLLATIWYLRRIAPDNPNDLDRAFAALTLLTVVVSPHMYVYDLTMLVLPVALLSRLAMNEPVRWQTWLPAGLLSLTLFAAWPLAWLAAVSGLQLGVLLLLVALGMVLQSAGPTRPAKSRASWNGPVCVADA